MPSTCPLTDTASNSADSHNNLRNLSARLERELAAAKLAFECISADCRNLTEKVIPNIRKQEREKCALKCEALEVGDGCSDTCAAAIRSMEDE